MLANAHDIATRPRLEFTGGRSRKFWQAEQDGRTLTFQWGRIGRPARTLVKQLETPQQAADSLQRLIRSKVRKGYRWRRPSWVQLVLPLAN